MNHSDFRIVFEQLTGHAPLSWQERLFHEHFATTDLPQVIDLPTGLGKTMVMAIWLIARAVQELTPRRLIYVVDRRTVVDQATDVASDLAFLLAPDNPVESEQVAERNPKLVERKRQHAQPLYELRQHLGLGDGRLAVSTLRGQLADNREWSRDLSRPAIIIGTVDLIGSALLFSGYRSSYKRRPLEAGLLGQDSLLVLDEAHLSKPFEKLICTINDDGRFQKDREGVRCGKPMRIVRMSATSGNSTGSKPFALLFDTNGNLTGKDAKDETVVERFHASKTLSVVPSEKLVETIATEADKLAADKLGSRIVIFVQTPKRVGDVRKLLEKKNKDYATRIAQLTGTMRGLERDNLVDTRKPLENVHHERRVMQRFLKPDNDSSSGSCFLICTSAGEVGFDLNGDHLVGDESPLDSWIQRLGRVNRRGKGDASVILVRDSKHASKTDFDNACIAASKLLTDGMSLSPQKLSALKSSEWTDAYAAACSPEPPTAELTDILLDAWSMTSITEPMPGRPEVGPWLRGIDNEVAQTTVAWRAELELLRDDPAPEKALRAIFARHPVRTHESLTVNTGHLLEFLKQIPKLKDRPPEVMTTRAAVRLPRGKVVCRTLQQLTDDPGILYADSTLILPATFGGLDAAGMLDSESIPKMRNADDGELRSLDVADHDGYEQTDAARSRLRILIGRSEDGSWTPSPLPGLSIPGDIKLKSDYDKSTVLFNDLKAADLRVRLVQPIRFDEEGDAARLLVILAPAPAKKDKENQLLSDHVGAVEEEARHIADALALAPDDPVRIALLFAANWHDEGKKARIWQVFANNLNPDGQPLGKMAQSRDPKSLRGYRHEFGSLLRIHHTDRCNTAGCVLPDNPDASELALHLIATHHGLGRPHFSDAIYTDFSDTERDAIHTDAIRRFARLQRKYGWWHLAWFENLLRCADALASADQGSEDDPTDTGDST